MNRSSAYLELLRNRHSALPIHSRIHIDLLIYGINGWDLNEEAIEERGGGCTSVTRSRGEARDVHTARDGVPDVASSDRLLEWRLLTSAATKGIHAMAQVFRPHSNTLAKLTLILIVGIFFSFFGIGLPLMWSDYTTEVNYMIDQPVQFSHKHHVKADGIDCRYCHTSVEVSASAGIPPTETCMSCHSQVWAGSPLLEEVRQSYLQNRPMRWNRVYFLPDYVYFNHSIHISKGIGCSSCHGQMDTMPLTRKVNPFYMKNCLSCHREPEKHLRPQSEIYNLNWAPPGTEKERTALGQRLLKEYKIDKNRITDCYTCHR